MLLDLAKNRTFPTLAAVSLLLLFAACGGGDSAEPVDVDEADPHAGETAEEHAVHAHEGEEDDGSPRVHFVGLKDGDTIPTLYNLQFAAMNFVIEPVDDDGTVNEGAGHHHIAIDGECLGPGVVIPTADPWIHFGDGAESIELEFSPGEHTLCLQIGDGEHRTLDEPGLSQTITVTVSDEPMEETEEGAMEDEAMEDEPMEDEAAAEAPAEGTEEEA